MEDHVDALKTLFLILSYLNYCDPRNVAPLLSLSLLSLRSLPAPILRVQNIKNEGEDDRLNRY